MVDLQMPKMNGVEFLERLSRLSLPRRPAAVVVTSKALGDNPQAYSELGVAATPLKPFSRGTLVRRIQRSLEAMGSGTPILRPSASVGV
jgi:CheY-like chemotaxis protein